MIFWQEVQKLEHRTLKTLDRCNPFDIVRITSRKVIVGPHETEKDRLIQQESLKNSLKDLITSGNLSRSEIEDRHSSRNPAHIATILAEMPGVRYSIRPIELHYSKVWISDGK